MTQSKSASGPESDQPTQSRPALKPRPTLFLVLAVFLALWVIALIVMRLRTIKPSPLPGPTPAPIVGR